MTKTADTYRKVAETFNQKSERAQRDYERTGSENSRDAAERNAETARRALEKANGKQEVNMIYQRISCNRKCALFTGLFSIVPSNMCIACGELTYKSGVGCSTCGYVGD